MAELNLGKGLTAGKVASNVQKKLTRAQEKVLQKLGKADETKDIAFEEGVINFNKQYTEGSKLQRDLRAYLEAVKAMHESSKNVQSCLADMYEPEWEGRDEVESVVEDCDVLWTDYHQKLVDHALISMDTYLGQFPDIKARIAKRDRKLVDFDSARHNYSITHKAKKNSGGIKITKPSTLLERATPGWAQGILSAHNIAQTSLSKGQAEEELERAQKVFEEINIDLQEELPSLWNSRVGFYISTFQSLSGFEEKFHKEMSRLDQDLYDTLVNLEKTDTTSGREESNHTLRPGGPPPIPKSPSKLKPAAPPPRPTATPSKEMKTENIINLFDAAADTPDISITSPTQPAAWDSWPEDNGAEAEAEVVEEHVQPPPQRHYDPMAAAAEGWGDDGTKPVRYDPVAAAAEGWGDDGSLPIRIDPVATAQDGWGDDGTQPVREEVLPSSSPEEEAPAAEAPAAEAPAAEAQGEAAEEETAQEEAVHEEDVQEEAVQEEEAIQEEAIPAAVIEGDEEGQGEGESSPPAAEVTEGETAPEETPTVVAESANGASETQEMPAGMLFKLQVMHDYAANDSDELDMKAGDIVLVIPFDNPEEQDDGWLMGMKQDDWIQNKEKALKGVFPENFTQRL